MQQRNEFPESDAVLYLEGFKSKSESQIVNIPIETYISLFCLTYCRNYDLQLHFVDFGNESNNCELPQPVLAKFRFVSWSTKDELLDLRCKVPMILCDSRKFHVSGLCSVLRWTIKAITRNDDRNTIDNLLGFRGGCLSACSENSVWTKFCELDLPQAAKENFAKKVAESTATISCLDKLELHLRNPVKTHNIGKRKLDIMKKRKSSLNVSIDNSTDNMHQTDLKRHLDNLIEDLKKLKTDSSAGELEHLFLEGIDLTLADVIALPCVHSLLGKSLACSWQKLPKIRKWYQNMLSILHVREMAAEFQWDILPSDGLCSCPNNPQLDLVEARNPDSTLYCRVSPVHRTKCKSFDPSCLIQELKENGVTPCVEKHVFKDLNWNELPPILHPSQGELPKSRVMRKSQQLESVVSAVLEIAKPQQIIVDFCSGGGHVGLLLAYFLPSCQVFLVENKEESMMRAKRRAESMALKNIKFFQSNMDYFEAHFDVGVSLHACGVATDMVIGKCMNEGAAFVCCPCCYGTVQSTDNLEYPLSDKFKALDFLPYQLFSLLTRCADRTELNTSKEEEGIYCMGLVDMDRKFYAEEKGYSVILTTLQPPSCSTKHNLLIGQKL